VRTPSFLIATAAMGMAIIRLHQEDIMAMSIPIRAEIIRKPLIMTIMATIQPLPAFGLAVMFHVRGINPVGY